MYQALKTHFNNDESAILHKYCALYGFDLSVLFGVNTEWFDDDRIKPNRMILVDGYYLLENEGEEGEWHMGLFHDKKFVFWGNYGSLKEALAGL